VADLIPTKEEMRQALEKRQGKELQQHFFSATVAICGLGGLGSNIAISLARAGVGKLILIDGGFSKTYRRKTGIAGYTLTYNSYGLTLSAHEPFDWSNEAVRDELDIVSHQEAVEYRDKRILVGDTDVGKRMMIRIEELKKLIQAYQDGEIAERDASSAYKW